MKVQTDSNQFYTDGFHVETSVTQAVSCSKTDLEKPVIL